MRQTRFVPLLVLLATLALGAGVPAAQADDPVAKPRALPGEIDIVFALDSSGSMQGLYASARDKLWAIVTEISRARPEPDLKVGLITYGGEGDAKGRNIRLAMDLSYDFDAVATLIDATTIRGGREFVGGAVETAVGQMRWRPKALKIIFVAGNEGVDQDQVVSFIAAAKHARLNNIRVNAIYCGNADDLIAVGWRKLAALGDGTFANIDQNNGTVHIASPYDKDLMRLSGKLNQTFRFFGSAHEARSDRQARSDKKAKAAGAPVAAERAAAKATSQYGRKGDLVRDSAAKDFDWSQVKQADLPKDLRGLSQKDLQAKLATLRAERAAVEAEIKKLAEKRTAHVAEERARLQLDDSESLDRVLRDAIREQAGAAGFKFPAK